MGPPGRGDEGLVVHHVDHREDVGQPLLEVVGDAQVDAGRDDLALGPDDPLGERCSLTRNARAICGVVRPMTARRVSASRASGARAGWQQREEQREPVVGGRDVGIGLGGRRLGEPLGRRAARRPRERSRSRRCAERRWPARRPAGPAYRRGASASVPRRPRPAPPPRRRRSRRSGGTGRPPGGPTPRGSCQSRRSRSSARWVTRTGCSPRPSAGSRRATPGNSRCGQVLVSSIAASMSGTSMTLNPPTTPWPR